MLTYHRHKLVAAAIIVAHSFVGVHLHSYSAAPNTIISQQHTRTDILIVGGGTSGITAGIQAARMGAKVLIVEATPWLGGMLTSAGVGATDGNHRLPSGLWGEFREKIRQHYGGAAHVETGWVSNTLFEPHVGDSIWKAMALQESRNLTIRYGFYPIAVEKAGKRITRVRFAALNDSSAIFDVSPLVVIDATELGDILELAGLPFDVGMEHRTSTGEASAPDTAIPVIQDLTWVAILKDYRVQLGNSADRRIPKPFGYDPREFDGCCKESCYTAPCDSTLVNAQTMLDYGRMPTFDFLRTGKGAKYMLNWPRQGNDYYFNAIGKPPSEQREGYMAAKQRTLRFVYHIQSTLGFRYLGLADDEFPTPDSLALIPYHREARRLRGLVRMTINHALQPYSSNLYRTAIAVGDYPVDHHHARYPYPDRLPTIHFPAIPSFSIPLGSLIPQSAQQGSPASRSITSNSSINLIAAEKCISVSNIMNGSTRLQPCVMLIGQAAGALAALSVRSRQAPAYIAVRSVQQALLQARCWLLPFLDVPPEHPNFEAIQKIAVVGALRGTGIPYKWANQTWFYPDSTMTHAEFITALSQSLPSKAARSLVPTPQVDTTITVGEALAILRPLQRFVVRGSHNMIWSLMNTPALRTMPLTRKDCAQILQTALMPFERIPVDIFGNLLLP
ncbi:MAG: FAD-dependent oxidoreductase [Bacteroidota bacterium]|nr:FAD-dependent oxidoreductase [Candidatus Kapabacteria bacterium]MDW8219341.1 FAD-dependent oxidoreductase [Bacteroidota bacterium]